MVLPSWVVPALLSASAALLAVWALYAGQPADDEGGEMIIEAVTTELIANPGNGNLDAIDVTMTSELTGEEFTVRSIIVSGTAADGPFRDILVTVEIADDTVVTDCGTGLAAAAFFYAGEIKSAKEADDPEALELAQQQYTKQFTLNSACQAAGFIG